MVFHNEDGNPARANIKQALGSFKDGDGDGDTHYERSHKGVKASANSDIIFFFTSAQDGNKLLDDERLSLADDLKKAHDQNQNKIVASWLKVIQAIYGSKFDLHVTDQPSIWCSILREVKSLKDSGFDFSSHCKKRIGDGSCTSFWYDIWLADAPLCVQFPRLFALELDKEIVVANKMGASSVSASFRRDVRDGAERQQWDDLSSIMNSVVLSSSKDRWTCDLSGDGEFKVKVIRNFIDDLFLPSSDVATRWVKFIPIKVNVFSWRARRDRLPTRVNLSRRGVLLDSHLCPLCNAAMEDVQHVFFRCDVARVVLRKICRWWDLDWQEICSFSDWDAWFLSFRLSSRLKSILEGVFYVAWWRIWRLRNQLVFDASPPNRSTIFDDIVSWSFLWCSSRYPTKKCHLLAHGFRKIISYDISKEKPMSNKELESKVEDMVEEVKTKMGELFETYKERFDFLSSNSSMGEHMESEVTSPNNGDNDFLNDYYNVDATSSYETETELDRYLREPKIELRKGQSLDILQWWKVRVLDPYRTRLSTTIVEALICTQDWVRKSRTQINWDDVEDLIKDDEIVKDMEEQLEKLTERDKAKQTGEI
ncbi:RNA-directed DNA polymerase, eukaryota [Tanacetum coccineum]